ncbi:hypothetical protein [Chryseolinea lacunae]|uniref:Uncharacterized protein n=1 Tax=Chryseolinea lacunae TaxID=2801331 RepID=A0ABS1KT41_9BACT|nr:hypothetical protein [Chryseolinea lacunae]MBL0742634.1 hypothetical protein [Chryseolinea lacunae]
MAKQLRFDVEDRVHYIFGAEGAEHYVVVATQAKPRVRRGGPDDGKPLYPEEDKDYIIVQYPLLTDRISPYVHVIDGELDPIH